MNSSARSLNGSDRRLKILVGVALLASTLISWRLFVKSVVEHPLYAAQAENQYEISKELPSKRGAIYAQDAELDRMVPIAATEERYDISVVPRNVKDKAEAAKTLSRLFGLNEQETFDAINTDKLYLSPLVRGVSKDQKEQLIEQGFAGLVVEKRHQRVYPEGAVAAHLLGFTNREGAGNYGLEAYYDEELRGLSGSVVGEKDTLGRIIATIRQVAPKDGVDLELSVDHNVQFAVEKRLTKAIEETQAESGQVVVMDPRNGEIIALAGVPAFDPNTYNEIKPDQQGRFQNPIISGTYEPGSIMKPVTMASAIDLGKIEPDTKETFGKSIVVQGYEINTALDKAYGEETMSQVLQNSDNVAMVWVAGKMSNEEMRSKFEAFGIGQTTGIDLAGEASGKLLGLADWREIHRATMAFGQGVSTTPIQIVRAWAAVINGGKLVTPHVVRRIVGERGVTVEATPPMVEGVIRDETSAKLRGMLESVIHDGPYGRTRISGYRMGGKTGTAQIADPNGGYLEDQYTHSLMGFFPVDDPQYLVLVKLDKPKSATYAETTAGPVFHDIAEYLFGYYKLPPDAE